MDSHISVASPLHLFASLLFLLNSESVCFPDPALKTLYVCAGHMIPVVD